MSRKIIFLILLCGLVKTSFSQSNLLWTKTYPANLYSSSYSPSNYLNQDTLVSTGVKQTSNGTKLVQLKHDLNGQLLSETIYGNDLLPDSRISDCFFFGNSVYLLRRDRVDTLGKPKIVVQEYDKTVLLLSSFDIVLAGDTSLYSGRFTLTSAGNFFNHLCERIYHSNR